ncbi:MAG: hypothetical protein WD795_06195 [Woeseia sp.]
MTIKNSSLRTTLLSLLAMLLGACSSGPNITRLQPVAEPADAPYENILVVSLFESYDTRRYLDQEVVKQLSARGVKAVAMTSLTRSDTPVNRDTLVKLVERINADSVLVTQLVSLETSAKAKDASPEATYNFRPTYYYNVYSVELTEYTEPKYVEFKHTLALATDLFSAESQQKVWAIASESKVKESTEHYRDYSIIVDEAEAIVRSMAQDRLIAR